MRPSSQSRALLLLPCLLLALSSAGAGEGRDLADCEARFAASPEAEESASCFSDIARRDRSRKGEAMERVQALLRRHPGHPWLTFHLGSLLWDETARSADLFREAAGLFEKRRMYLGAVRARSNLRLLLLRLNRYAEADAEVQRTVQTASESGDPLVLARARILEAAHLFDRNRDLRRADELLSEAEAIVFPGGPYLMRRDCLHYQASVDLALGRIDAARQRLRRLVELTVAEVNPYAEASARYTLLRALRDELALLPRPGAREDCLDLARQSLAVARAAGHSEIEAKSLAILGALTPGPEALPLFERCFEAAERLADKSHCRSMMARSLAAEEPEAALRAVDEALDLAKDGDSPAAVAYSWRERMRVSWRLGPPGQAVLDSFAALDAMEMLRDLQTATEGRAELFSTWVSHYHWLAGRLLEEHLAGRDPAALATAFEVQERMRARTLIDTLEAAQAAGEAAVDTADLQARRVAVLAAISRAQRQGATDEVQRLELEERDLREEIARLDPAFAALRERGFAVLEAARKALAEDEALLSFQIAPWTDMVGDFHGGAWLIVATRGGVRAVALRDPLANRPALRSAVEIFAGLFQSETGNEEGRDGAAALYRALLADGLAGLPEGIRRLVIIPDDALHQVPFAALRPSPEGEPLTERYEITLVPSATLWLRWRDEGSPPAEAPVLVFADPAVSAAPNPPATERVVLVSPWTLPENLGPLPWARREGKAAVGHLGGKSELRLGSEASEAWLKRNGPGRFGILHLATHARADSVEPDRSFVLLSPGGAEEDGLLRMREIVGLDDLRGRMVVLSTCSSASGEILRGEGVMGLARAFFQTGAHTVVATLWPLRDDHGAALFDRFYHHLGRGLSVSAALQAAQRDRMEEGASPAAWAGVVVLGDGDRVPLPGGRKRRGPVVAGGLAAVALLGALGLLAFRRRRTRISP